MKKLKMTNTDMILAQRQWIAEHGANLEGYRRMYNDTFDPDSDQGLNIYNADIAELRRLEDLAKKQERLRP